MRLATQIEAFPEVVGVADLDTDERYTLDATDFLCRKLARVKQWDLDVAACADAHRASKYFTKADNGLLKSWWGRVWCNPPWSNIEPWVERAHNEFARGRLVKTIGMLLPSTRTDTQWWQKQVEPFRDRANSPLRTFFLPGRIHYGKPGDLLALNQRDPEFGGVFLCWFR